MKSTYMDFIEQNPNCSSYKDNVDAENVFNFINQDNMIIRMAEFADQNKPALAAIVCDLEKFFDGLSNPTFDFEADFDKTVVGRMVKTVLKPLGYYPSHNKALPKNTKAKYFKSASCYRMDERDAILRIVKKIEPIV